MKKSQLKQIIKEEISKILNEGKQVGILYHFTPVLNMFKILKTQHLLPNEENQISTTRSPSLDTTTFQEDSNVPQCRLMFDGNKISTKYKIKPFKYDQDEDAFEEQIIINGKPFYFFPYLKRIDIFMGNSKRNKGIKLIPKLVEELENLNISYKIYDTSTTNQSSYTQSKEGNPSNINTPKKVEIYTQNDLYFSGMKFKTIELYLSEHDLDRQYLSKIKVAESPKYPEYYVRTNFTDNANKINEYFDYFNKNRKKIKGIKIIPLPFLNDKSWRDKWKYLDNPNIKKFTPGVYPDAYMLIPKNEVND